MIEQFGCAEAPFTREFSTNQRYQLSFMEEEIKALVKVVESRMSGLIIAPAGTGKTSLLREIKKRLPESRYKVHYIKVTALSKPDLCREIARAVGAKPAGTYPALVRSVQAKLEESFTTDCIRPVLIIDEAHDMRSDVLSMLRIITNFEMDSKLVASIILAGQPPLKQKLYEPGLEDIRQRLAHCCELRLLTREESKAYMKHRIKVAGGRKFPFDDEACDAVFEMARGNLRAIDRISYKSMEIGSEKKEGSIGQNIVLASRDQLWV